jgi:diguanylate cyclase (GGDEF)-like protein
VARVGGEEFAVLLPLRQPGTGGRGDGALRHTAGRHDRETGRQSVRVTTTAGVAEQQAGESLNGLMARADAALYAGKQAGRNRVVLARALAGRRAGT